MPRVLFEVLALAGRFGTQQVWYVDAKLVVVLRHVRDS
jgi:hypothetical protein